MGRLGISIFARACLASSSIVTSLMQLRMQYVDIELEKKKLVNEEGESFRKVKKQTRGLDGKRNKLMFELDL